MISSRSVQASQYGNQGDLKPDARTGQCWTLSRSHCTQQVSASMFTPVTPLRRRHWCLLQKLSVGTILENAFYVWRTGAIRRRVRAQASLLSPLGAPPMSSAWTPGRWAASGKAWLLSLGSPESSFASAHFDDRARIASSVCKPVAIILCDATRPQDDSASDAHELHRCEDARRLTMRIAVSPCRRDSLEEMAEEAAAVFGPTMAAQPASPAVPLPAQAISVGG